MNQLVLSSKFQKDLKKILSKQPNLKLTIKKKANYIFYASAHTIKFTNKKPPPKTTVFFNKGLSFVKPIQSFYF